MNDRWRDHYRILGVRRDATQDEIKEAWIFGVKAFHPDKFAGSSQRQQAVAQERTKAVNEAYYILSDATRRADYDHEYVRKASAETAPPPPPRSAHPPEPTKTASSADASAKHNDTQGTRPPKTGSATVEQNRNEPLPKAFYGAGLYIAWLVATAMLVSAAVERHPYSFYMLLRWICCPIFAYSAFAAHERNRAFGVWVFGALAALYNPIFRVHLDRTIWTGINWFTVGAIIGAAILFWRSTHLSKAASDVRHKAASISRRANIGKGQWSASDTMAAAMIALIVIIAALLLWDEHVSQRQKATSSASPAVSESTPAIPESSPEPSVEHALSKLPDKTTQGDRYTDFITTTLWAVEQRDINTLMSRYADKVVYRGYGVVDKAFIRKDLESYFRRWPVTKVQLNGAVQVLDTKKADEKRVLFSYDFSATSPGRGATSVGSTSNEWWVWETQGTLKVFGEMQKITRDQKK